jgi:hypothetical protein
MSSVNEEQEMAVGFAQFERTWGENALLALDTLAMRSRKGIPSWIVHTMDVPFMEEMTGHAPGKYKQDPHSVYLDFQRRCGTCAIDQYIPDNPLTMGEKGYESERERGATTGAEEIMLNGIRIDSPEAVVEHMERFDFPHLEKAIAECDPEDEEASSRLVERECETQRLFGNDILKIPYGGGFQCFPGLRYFQYGYVQYFTAYVLYPEVMEKDFRLQADLAVRRNRTAAKAYTKGSLPKLLRLDHDMTDSRGTLVDIKSLDEIWFPHLARSLEPYHEAGVRLIWHCDGNVMQMVPRLIEVGVSGFQGFQYEDGVDYERICRMEDRDGSPLMIWAGVSVTKTLPFGSPAGVAEEMKWLVKNGPRAGLFLGGSSSICPGTKRENIKAMIEGIRYYREHGREGW